MTLKADGPVLNKLDLQSETWKKLQAYFEARLEVLRLANDADMPAEKTSRLRGRIFEVKRLLDLAEEDAKDETLN